jgi:hypothetical protein
MSLLNLTPPSIGQPNATEDVDVVNAFNTIQTWANGNVDESNLANATAQRLGLNTGGNVGRGVFTAAGPGTRTNAAYGQLSDGPDQITGIVLPTNGLIAIAYQAVWNESVDNTANATIFLGANQLRIAQGNAAAPPVQETVCGAGNGIDTPLATGPGGLMGNIGTAATAYTGDVTTGQIIGNATFAAAINGSTGNTSVVSPIGGPCYVFAAAGTYTVSVQFRASSGTVTAKNRKLWCWSVGF